MSLDILPTEAALVYWAARHDPSPEVGLALLRAEPNWGKVVWLASRERASTRLWSRLTALPGVVLPEEATGLQQYAMVAEFRMMHLQQLLHDVVARLDDVGIPVLLLKGAALASTVYRDFADRPMSDVDLLVPGDRAREAWELLRVAGWRWSSHEKLDQVYETSHHHLPPLSDPSGASTLLEVHTRLFPGHEPFTVDHHAIWVSAETIQLSGRPARVMDVAHQIAHLSIHFVWSHQMESAGWRTFRDIDTLVRSRDVDWDQTVRVAESSRSRTCCYWALRLTRTLLDAPVPEETMKALRPPGSARRLDLLERMYIGSLAPIDATAFPSAALARRVWSLGVRPHWSRLGDSRPWDASDLFTEARADDEEHPSGPSLLARHWQRLPHWGRYLRWVVFPSR